MVIASEYHAWQNMKNRCYNKNLPNYKYYGGRGIKVCDEWLHSFSSFHDYIGDKPTPQHSLDRIDNNNNYGPGNVRWATPYEQQSNRRNNTQHVGVSFTSFGLWSASIRVGGTLMFRKQFKYLEDAILVRKRLEEIYVN